ncbi:DUF4862 family protein [Streptomyces sp. NPDC004629]|uniref:DUF4862 family protein n=1 Tax=Streptomyces sp. NPDC004629 TaxID=3364705 RepID=UPI00368150BE
MAPAGSAGAIPVTGDRVRRTGVPGYILGAYAAEPAVAGERQEFYRQLARMPDIGGLEVPFAAGPDGQGALRLPPRVPPHWRVVVTALPATVARASEDPTFGLASSDESGRAAAVAAHRQMRDAVRGLTQRRGPGTVPAVLVHSAPGAGDVDAFARSLAEIASWDWSGARLLVEHCDARRPGHSPAKGYLPLTGELRAVEAAGDDGMGLVVNWGRSVLEERSAAGAVKHLRAAASAGRLAGLVFSGVSANETLYGEPWADAHLPVATPSGLTDSLLTPARARAAMDEASAAWLYGAKFAVRPRTAAWEERVAVVRASLDALPRRLVSGLPSLRQG